MILQVKWTKEAKVQFKDIIDYWDIRNNSTRYSQKLINIVDKAIARILEFPEIGRVTENDRIRLKIIKDYFLYYSFNDTELIVLGISDMRRDPDYLKSLFK